MPADSKRLVREGALLFAMFSVGLAAVLSRDPSALASEMWPAVLGAVAVYTVKRRQVPLVLGLVLVPAFAAYWLGGRPLGLSVGGAIGVRGRYDVPGAASGRFLSGHPAGISNLQLLLGQVIRGGSRCPLSPSTT